MRLTFKQEEKRESFTYIPTLPNPSHFSQI